MPIEILKYIYTLRGSAIRSPRRTSVFKALFAFTKKATSAICISSVITVYNLPLLNAFEGHSIGVNASVCDFSQTQPMSYWKNHPDIYATLLPQALGALNIDSPEKAHGIFHYGENTQITRDKLKAQLLTLRYNIKYFMVEDYVVESEGKTLGNLASEAENLLLEESPVSEESIVNMVNILEHSNNLDQINVCSLNKPLPPPPFQPEKLLINKVYYNVNDSHSDNPDEKKNNAWIEVYNPTLYGINIKGLKICDNEECDDLSASDIFMPPNGFAIITSSESTWKYWTIPEEVVKIHLNETIGNGLDDDEMLYLKNPSDKIIDQMNWGLSNESWTNYNDELWNPPVQKTSEGEILSRSSLGPDTDQALDWIILNIPQVSVTYPNGGETWWVGRTYDISWSAKNPNGPDDDLKIDIFYSNDSGLTWAKIASNTENTGTFRWRVPLFINGYFTVSRDARIKVMATGPENFMVQNWDMSDEDFCPPIDYNLLTPQELEMAREIGLIPDDSVADQNTADDATIDQHISDSEESEDENLSGNVFNDSSVNNTNNSEDITPAESVQSSFIEDGDRAAIPDANITDLDNSASGIPAALTNSEPELPNDNSSDARAQEPQDGVIGISSSPPPDIDSANTDIENVSNSSGDGSNQIQNADQNSEIPHDSDTVTQASPDAPSSLSLEPESAANTLVQLPESALPPEYYKKE